MFKNYLIIKQLSLKTVFLVYTLMVLLLIGSILLWLINKTYSSFIELRKIEIEYSISKIDIAFNSIINNTESVTNYIGKQIAVSSKSVSEIREILTSFSNRGSMGDSISDNLSISMFSWVNNEKMVIINSEYGFIRKPYDLSKRDYLKSTIDDPWSLKFGSPVIGVVSGQEIIPAGLGVQDFRSKKYLGTIILGFDICKLSEKIKKIISNKNLDFAVINSGNEVIFESNSGIFSEDSDLLKYIKSIKDNNSEVTIYPFSFFDLRNSYLIADNSSKKSYYIVAGYQNYFILKGLFKATWTYILGFFFLVILFIFTWISFRKKIIKPIIQLSKISEIIVRDLEEEVQMPRSNILEIANLIKQVKLIEEYKFDLLQAKKSQERFFANMSHELRTPLNGIINFSMMMKKEMFGPLDTEYKEMVDDIHYSGAHLLSLVNDILDFSKMDVGKMKLNEEVFDIKTEIASSIKIVLSDSNRYSENYKSKIVTNIEIGDIKINADRRMFKQILLNLLSNAVKFVEDGIVNLKLFLDHEKNLVLEVEDTGIGIKREDLDKLVVEFGQVGTGYYRGKKQGSGLGLFLVKKMSDLHQAEFTISSVYGVGTSVKIVFPKERVIV
ncbi:MAG: sensor histidine kinase [Rickettsiales bacterium]|nr:sensor histidine kinase [Rickettsiales bacterium]